MVIVDTGFFYSLADRKDNNHNRALRALEMLDDDLITTWPVLTETCHLLLKRLGEHSLNKFIETLQDQNIFEIESLYIPRIKELMKSYSDLPMDLADASLVVLAEHLGEGKILTTDKRDFKTYRWKNHKPFIDLMFNED